MSTAQSTEKEEIPWHATFPPPTITAPLMPRTRVLQMLSLKGVASLLVVDVRRTDFEGGCIRGSLNVPAQGFWWNRGILYELAYKSGIEWVVFTCGSSSGRGPRCAAWFLEYVRGLGDEDMQILTLDGGVKGWVGAGAQYTRLMDGYVARHWTTEESQKKESREEGGAEGAGGDVAA